MFINFSKLENKNILDKLLNEQKSKMIDQGELGKKLATSIAEELGNKSINNHDASTSFLLKNFLED